MNRRDALKSFLGLSAATTIHEIKAEDLGPRDVIVIESAGHLSDDMAGRLRDYARHVWPDRKILVLDKGLSVRVLRG